MDQHATTLETYFKEHPPRTIAEARQVIQEQTGIERSIGWWVKEHYRSMRGCKREQSALNVSRLIAHAGNHLSRGLHVAKLFA